MEQRSRGCLERRLQSSQEARRRQAVLVRKLREKVLQYRTRCRELEQQLEAGGGSFPSRWEATEDHRLKKALLQLEEEQQRCENLAGVNSLLQQRLDQAREVNAALKEDVGKLTSDWMRAREQLELKESEWRDERELYVSYLRAEQNRLLGLWHQVVTLHHHFLEMKAATDRDLSELKAEHVRLSGSILANCSRLSSGVQPSESITLGRPVLKDQAQQPVGQEISQKTREVMLLQAKGDPEKKELQDRPKDFALEGKHSVSQSEVVVARKAPEGLHLQRALQKQEKYELTTAPEKAEQSSAELAGALNKLSAEAADPRVAPAEMGGMDDTLMVDEAQPKELVLQLKRENDVLSRRVDELERTKTSDQEKLNLCERRNEELSAEKAHLEQLLKKAEEQRQGLQVELRTLAEEKAETQEKLSQVFHQQESASSSLEQLRRESSCQGHALAKVSEEKEFLVQEKAALEVRLAAMEQDRQGLSEELAEARSVKETLESSLLETQQHLSQLKISRSQLEIQLHTVMQAKEVIKGEVKCLQSELEAERSLMRQEQENMAQQLLQTQQQYDNTLRLGQSDHEAERNKLLQDLASEREGHHSELQKVLEQWEKEKAEMEREHEKKLFEMKQKVATMEAQQEEELTRVENAKQEALLGKEREKTALLKTLLQTQGELRGACQQLEQLRQEVEEQRANGQQAAAEGEQLSWLSEKRLLLQRLERLQRAVARLELEKSALEQFTAELRRTLELVERERRRLKRYCSGKLLPDAGGLSASDQHKTPAPTQEESLTRCSRRLGELRTG